MLGRRLATSGAERVRRPRGKRPPPQTPGGVTESELRRAADAVRKAEEKAGDVRQARDLIVRRALADGWSFGAVAEMIGLTRSAVQEINRR